MATITIKHASLTGAAANPAVLVDGPKWDATHTVTGVENVDNTSDVNKPVSTAQATADALVASNAATALAAEAVLARNANNLSGGTVPAARLPVPSASTLGGIQSIVAVSHNWINSISTSGVPSQSQPAFTDISGSVASTQMPALTGDVTTVAGAVATTIAANAVTNAKMATMAARTVKANLTAGSAVPTDATAEQIQAILGKGSIAMWPASTQGAGAWNVLDPWGVAVSTAGTTTQGLQEAITAAKTNNLALAVFGRGALACSTVLTIPSMFFGNISIAPEVSLNFAPLGAAALVTVDSQENSIIRVLCQFVQNSADTGDVVLVKPTNAAPTTGNINIAATVLEFGTIAPASAGASGLHLDSTNGSIIGNPLISVLDINGGVVGLKETISAATPHVIQENYIKGGYWHGMSGFGVQVGTSTTNANFLRRNTYDIARIAPNANAAVGFSTFETGSIIRIGGINAEEAPGGANLADGIIWQSGATGNIAIVGQSVIGTGVNVLNSSGNQSNVSVVSGAHVGGTIDNAIVGATAPVAGTFTNLQGQAGNGSANVRISGQLTAQVVQSATAANTTETDLQTYTMPANTLDATGRGVRVTAWGSYGATANNKTIKGYFGAANVVYNSTALAQNGTGWWLEYEVYKTGASTQCHWGNIVAGNAVPGLQSGTDAQTDTAGIVIKVTGQNGTAAANDIVCRGMSVKMIN